MKSISLPLSFTCILLVTSITCGTAAAAPSTTQTSSKPTAPADHLAPPPHVQFDPDIEYAKITDKSEPPISLKLDLATPQSAADVYPCILAIHGGGWTAGNRQELDNLAFHLAQHGYVAASIEYRLAPKYPFPACIQDVRAAVRFLRANAGRLKIDPKRIGAVGFSAGAHLAMMLGVAEKLEGIDDIPENLDQPSQVKAVVSFFGPTDLNGQIPPVSHGILRAFLGGQAADTEQTRRRASPITYVTEASAPMLLLQGTEDPLVPYDQAFKMTTAMQTAHVPGRVELIVGASHGWGGPEYTRTAQESFAFFDHYLKPPAN